MKNYYFKSHGLTFLPLVLLAALITLISCKDDNYSAIVDPNADNNNSAQQPPEEIIVTVDADGKADGGHHFTKIDDTNFYIDDIQYTAKDGNLVVSGFDEAFFKDDAKLITRLIYDGRKMDVVAIGKKAFSECEVLKSVIIPQSVTSIGDSVFYKCSGLTSITIPKKVKSIDVDAFLDCSNLASVYITDLKAWCNISFAVSRAISIEGVGVGSNPLSCAHQLFLNGQELKELVIPDGVTSIKEAAFDGCSGLTSVTIPNGVTSIEGRAFSGCYGLTSVTIPNSVTNINLGAFGRCGRLKALTIPENVTYIANNAFEGCCFKTSSFINKSALTSDNNWGALFYDVEYGDGLLIKDDIVVRYRGTSASVTIPESVTSIDGRAFSDCNTVTSINVKSINPPTFSKIPESPSGGQGQGQGPGPGPQGPGQVNISIHPFPFRSQAVLKVPIGSKAVYQAAQYWSDFKEIIEVADDGTTLWGLIKDDPDFSRFVNIVRNAKHYQDETGTMSADSYIDILNGEGKYTVWVPDNNALTETEYQEWMQILESGDIVSKYNVQRQFLDNHIASGQYLVLETGSETVKMINGKKSIVS